MSNSFSNINVISRNRSGTGGSRAIRREGFVPAVIYGNKKDPISIKVDERDIIKGMSLAGFTSTVMDLKLDGKTHKAIVRDIQTHPVTDRPLHVDFQRVSEKSMIHVNVPIEFINEEKSPGIKRGGVLNAVLHEIEIICPADQLPDHLTIDLDGLAIGDSVHLEKLTLPSGAKVASMDKDLTIATIVAPTLMKEETTEKETEAEGEEGEAKETEETENATDK